ncbi:MULTISPECIES: aminoglycoside phosphotransferase family protein [unclassified Ornithinimicrobium]|uniref:aminoglycoside phosphotransferase family protein n=1 Tax=unclassified Ornithinimicrobium TaxID=2615080 RepID=UPI003854955F
MIPDAFRATLAGRPPDAAGDTDGDTWLGRLPHLLDEHLRRWELQRDGPPWHGECALVLPVRRGREPAALKLTWPHPEARHEHLALRLWDGKGAVRLLAADPTAYALLLERLDGDRDLTTVPVLEACEVIGTLSTRLDRPATPQLDTVEGKAVRWREQLARATPLVPRRLTEQALATLPDLLAEAPPLRLVHEDLHDLNVLAPLDPDRGDWLAIDPKPVAGEWAYAVAPIVWNRPEALARAHNLRGHARLRADVVTDAAGLDPDRVRAWTFVRLVLNAVQAAARAPVSDDVRARMIALAKAFAD